MHRYSILDLVPVTEGGSVGQALANAADLAAHTESLGYTRYWVAEHHGMKGIASAATSVVIGHIAAATKSIRVGAGGIMLPNHAPVSYTHPTLPKNKEGVSSGCAVRLTKKNIQIITRNSNVSRRHGKQE